MKMMQNGSAAGHSKRRALLALSLALVVLCIAVGGTIAWLIDSTSPLTNTFEPSKIDITLTETTGTEYKMVPGTVITKDPKVTVLMDSEPCWLFVRVQELNSFGSFMSYQMGEDWIQLLGTGSVPVAGVFYQEVGTSAADEEFPVIKDNHVTVSSLLVEGDMSGLEEDEWPKLEIKAYAVQRDSNIDSALEAWGLVTP